MDAKNKKNKNNQQSFSCTVLYSKLDAQKLSSVVGSNRAGQMINSEKNVHMFMVEDKT
jgi:U3 small nucleolar RNA-associated protein 25